MEKKIGLIKKATAKKLYSDGDVISVKFKTGKHFQLNLPAELSKYLRLNKKSKLYCAVVGGTIQIVGHKILSTIPVATENPEEYISQVE
jgi:hypothetical protein